MFTIRIIYSYSFYGCSCNQFTTKFVHGAQLCLRVIEGKAEIGSSISTKVTLLRRVMNDVFIVLRR